MTSLVIIAVTCLVSILCFYGKPDARRLWFTAYGVWHRKEWYRMLSYGLIHGGWGHLFFNMLTLYFFGAVVEQYFRVAFGSEAGILTDDPALVEAAMNQFDAVWAGFKCKDCGRKKYCGDPILSR